MIRFGSGDSSLQNPKFAHKILSHSRISGPYLRSIDRQSGKSVIVDHIMTKINQSTTDIKTRDISTKIHESATHTYAKRTDE